MNGEDTLIVTLVGPFTDEDLTELCIALRKCERRQWERNFTMAVKGPRFDVMKAGDAKTKLNEMYAKASSGIPFDTHVIGTTGG
jgi:hypothetical protein